MKMSCAWIFGSVAVTVEEIDFLDPELAGSPDARERGVRLEVRLADSLHQGTVYASPALTLTPAVCRIDLLESAPGAADRMHWHPTMREGEPREREFDREIPESPLTWVAARLGDLVTLLERSGVEAPQRYADEAARFADRVPDMVDHVARGLERTRATWPEAVEHDERGLAPVR